MFCLTISLLIMAGFYCLAVRLGAVRVHQKVILAGLLSFSQIILTQLVLGLLGWLYLKDVVLLNGSLLLIVLLCSGILKKDIFLFIREEYQRIKNGIKAAAGWENFVLGALFLLICCWVCIAIYFLPPRTSDDLTYHLPVIYEYVIKHRIFLLPVDFYSQFSFPQNAELLFMWPAIFFHSQQFVDSIQFVAALWGIVVIYGLARVVDVPARTAVFVSLLFFFTPVVLAQLGSNYIDIITAVFFLAAVYCAALFYRSSNLVYFYAAALACGVLLGMKYNFCILPLAVMPLLAGSFKKGRYKHWAGFITIFLMCGGFWYVRNFLVFAAPIYPPLNSLRAVGPTPVSLQDIPIKIGLLLKDPGLGSLHGGFGLIFWGMAFPTWIYVLYQSMRRGDQVSKINLRLAVPFVLGVTQLMLVPVNVFQLTARYSLFIVALGLVALGQVLTMFQQVGFFTRAVKAACVVWAGFSLLYLSELGSPSYCINHFIKRYIKGDLEPEQYNKIANSPLKDYAQAWDLLNYLTLDRPQGLSCYLAMFRKPLSAPLYGAKLQNRVWNLQQEKDPFPDAFLYIYGGNKKLNYFGAKITPEAVAANPVYVLVLSSQRVLLFISKDLLRNPQIQQRLTDFQGRHRQ